jgi:NTE family protein
MKLVYTLSGGAAYGYAHVGVLRFLEESGLRPDAVVGTSMGAIVGGLYVCGYNAAQIEKIAEEVRAVELMRLFFPSFPRGGIIDTDGIKEFFRQYVGDRRIENLPYLYRSVAVDINTGDEIVFDSGPLLDAMIASMSIPAVFKPYPYGGRALVDGGVVNNLPWDIARRLGRNHVIVNVAPSRKNPRRRLYTSRMAAEGGEAESGQRRSYPAAFPAEREPGGDGGGEGRTDATSSAAAYRPSLAARLNPAAPAAAEDGEEQGGMMQPFRRLRERFSAAEGVPLQHLMRSFARSSAVKDKALGLPEIATRVMAIVNERVPVPRSSRGWSYAYVHPDLMEYSLNDFQKAKEIIELGYRTASTSTSFVKEVRTISLKLRRR